MKNTKTVGEKLLKSTKELGVLLSRTILSADADETVNGSLIGDSGNVGQYYECNYYNIKAIII